MKTALHEIHTALGARTTDFAGWEMPLRYGSAVDEHHAVRSAAGLFDLSHMGEIEVSGPTAAAALDASFISRISSLEVGRAKYTMLCNADGFILDDLIVYRRGEERFLVVANAANRLVVADVLTSQAATFGARIDDRSLDTALLAVQGPASAGIVEQITGPDAVSIGYYRCTDAVFAGTPMLVARTGYTGEDGFELYIEPSRAAELWAACTEAGAEAGILPVGLAARDSLRLEAGMALYGHELDETTTPFDAGAGRMVAFGPDGDREFTGAAALAAIRDSGVHARLVGVEVEGRRPARDGYPVLDADGARVGVITSGTLSPTLDKPVAMARLDHGTSDDGLAVDVRGAITPASVVDLPFYRRNG